MFEEKYGIADSIVTMRKTDGNFQSWWEPEPKHRLTRADELSFNAAKELFLKFCKAKGL